MYVKVCCVVLNHVSSDSHSSHTIVNIQVSCLSSSSLKLVNWYSCSHAYVSKRPPAGFAIHHNTAKEELDVTSYIPCILSLACNWSIQGKFNCTSNPIKVAHTWSLGLGSCTASRLTFTRDGHFECKWSYMYMYVEGFMTPCKFKSLNVMREPWLIGASSIENCRCEQLCKCPSQDYTSNLANLAAGHGLWFRP